MIVSTAAANIPASPGRSEYRNLLIMGSDNHAAGRYVSLEFICTSAHACATAVADGTLSFIAGGRTIHMTIILIFPRR